MKVCFSGTFNVLHKGHKFLIDKAFQIAGEKGTVYIGVTKGQLLTKKEFIIPFDERVNAIRKYLESKGFEKRSVIRAIYDRYGPAVYEEYDIIMVSPSTLENAKDINKKRVNNGKTPLKIVKTPFVVAEDKKPISSSRILKNEIDKEGRIVTQ